MTNLSQVKADFYFEEKNTQMAEPRGRHPKEKSAGVKASGFIFLGGGR